MRAEAEATGDPVALNAALQLEVSQGYDRRLWALHNQMLWAVGPLVTLSDRITALEARNG